jgi:adenosylhomocysteine nucleosidase
MKIAVITALPAELWAVRAALGESRREWRIGRAAWRSSVAGHEVLAVEAGMGFDNAARTTYEVIRAESPQLIVSAGFCGGLTADLKVGDVVVANRLFTVKDDQLEEQIFRMSDVCLPFVASFSANDRLFGGQYVSTPQMLSKQKLAGLLPCDTCTPAVVEMESAAIAGVAAENEILFAAIRTVSDQLDEELGFSLDELCDDAMNIRLNRVLTTCFSKPRIIPQLIRLARNSRVAAASLSRAFKRFLAVV